MTVYLPIVFVLMAVFFLTIGCKVVVSNKPLLVSSKKFFIFIALAFSPQFIILTTPFFSSQNLSVNSYISLFIYLTMLAFFWLQLKGYIAIGISDRSFRNALHYSLNKNQIKFEEQLSLIKLPTLDSEIQVAIQSWIGSGQLKLNGANDKILLETLINGINEYYRVNSIRVNKIISIFYILFGAFMLTSSVALFFLI